LIDIARPLSRESEEIYSIISEEAAPYFAGQKSAVSGKLYSIEIGN